MTGGRTVFAAAVVVVALALELSVLPRLSLPGATPDVVLLCVVAFGLAYGRRFGAVSGFAAGLAVDLVPPAEHPIGSWAFVLTVVGYLAGHAQKQVDRSVVVPMLVVAGAAAASPLLFAGLGNVVGDPRPTWPAAFGLLPTAILYDVVLAPFVVSGVIALARRLEPEPVFR